LEEHDMVREYGETYEDYKRRVPMLVPRLTEKRKLSTTTATMSTTVHS
jgi:hypothetical protein